MVLLGRLVESIWRLGLTALGKVTRKRIEEQMSFVMPSYVPGDNLADVKMAEMPSPAKQQQ